MFKQTSLDVCSTDVIKQLGHRFMVSLEVNVLIELGHKTVILVSNEMGFLSCGIIKQYKFKITLYH